MTRQCQRGLTLIETLIGLSLSLTLLAGLISATAQLQGELHQAAGRVLLGERASLGLSVLTAAAVRNPPFAPDNPGSIDPCSSPVADPADVAVVMQLAAPGVVPCFPHRDMPAGSPILMIDSLLPCDPDCPEPSSPGFLYLNPGCHPILSRDTPEVRRVERQQRPTDCGIETRIALLERQLFYFRAYAWARGDNVGAIMTKRLKPELVPRWGRAEMLLAGVADWQVLPRYAALTCPPLHECHTSAIAQGVEVTLSVHAAQPGQPAVEELATLTLTRTLAGITRVIP